MTQTPIDTTEPTQPTPVDPCDVLEQDSEIEITTAILCAITLLGRASDKASSVNTAHGRVVYYALSFVISALRAALNHTSLVATQDDIPF